VYHLKTHISSGKECQASIINYRKDGSPFINLVTVIPISWDTDEIAYFVGFQVDLVEQPNAILEKMRNGTYVVNYSLLPTNAPAPAPVPTVPAAAYKQEEQDAMQKREPERWTEQKPVKVVNPTASANALAAAAQSSMTIAPELLEVMGQADNASELDDDAAKKKWNKMLLDHVSFICDPQHGCVLTCMLSQTGDFVHVLSLKGSFLYVSPSVKSMLEYEPSDLIGKTLQSVCHPSDIVPVMRELKDSSTITHPNINLLYRFRRKSSGYIWLEAQGKLYIEQSKSRKCVILVGRERPVYKLSWQDLRLAGGLGEKEFWSKISLDGKFLYNTPTVKAVIGHDADALRGTSIFELIESSKAPELLRALQDAAAGKSVRLHHKLRNEKRVLVDCITNFYPNSQAKSPTQSTGKGLVHPSIIAQTNEYSSEMRRRATLPAAKVSSLPGPSGVAGTPRAGRPTYLRAESGVVRDMIVTTPEPAAGDGGSEDSGSSKEEDREKRSSSGPQSGSDSSAPSTFSAIPSTYKTLLHHPSSQNDNVFDELDTTRTTSWQYELHQLKLTNKKLKEELQMLQAAKRKRKKKEELQSRMEASASPAPQPNPANPDQKICANCGRTDSPE
jgi:PAS domain S-box-containing protein